MVQIACESKVEIATKEEEEVLWTQSKAGAGRAMEGWRGWRRKATVSNEGSRACQRNKRKEE